MGTPAAAKPNTVTGDKAKDKKPEPTPAELRAAVGLPESATDAELRAAQKVERFKTVAKRRTDNALTAMHNLARCANRGNYTYTPDQVDTIMNALTAELQKLEAAFTHSATDDRPQVSL